MLTKERAEHIKLLVKKAGEIDKKREVFGASKHQYLLNPVIPIERIQEYEEKYQLKLPEEYVFFLTNIGNGGAGPFYGIYSLEAHQLHTEYLEEGKKEAWIISNKEKEKWAEKMHRMDTSDDDEYEEVMQEICSGIGVIGTQGCTYDNLLVISGEERGKIAYIDWNLEPEYPPFFTGMTFLEWYEGYFNEIISGHSVTSYGYHSLGTEEEVVASLKTTESEEEKKKLLISLYRFSEASSSTVQVLSTMYEEQHACYCAELLFRFDLEQGILFFQNMMINRNLDGMIHSARKLPDEKKDMFYQDMLNMLFHENVEDKAKILYFLSDCSQFCARDVISFAMDYRKKEESRTAAIYVMGQALDKYLFWKEYNSLLEEDSWRIAHTALQSIARKVSSEKNQIETQLSRKESKRMKKTLLNTFEKMEEKYKQDKCMCNNLKIAVETFQALK